MGFVVLSFKIIIFLHFCSPRQGSQKLRTVYETVSCMHQFTRTSCIAHLLSHVCFFLTPAPSIILRAIEGLQDTICIYLGTIWQYLLVSFLYGVVLRRTTNMLELLLLWKDLKLYPNLCTDILFHSGIISNVM